MIMQVGLAEAGGLVKYISLRDNEDSQKKAMIITAYGWRRRS